MYALAIEVLERHAKGGAWLFDQEAGRVSWSDGVYSIHGLTRDSYTPNLDSALDFYTAPSRALLEAELTRALASGTGWSIELDIIRADGVLRHVQTIGQVETRPGREPLLAGALFDVHDQIELRLQREQAERRHAENSLRWRTASENVGLALIEIDLDAGRYRASGAFAEQLGIAAADGIPMATWLGWIHADDVAQRQRLIDTHLADDSQSYVSEYRLQIAGADEIWVKEAGRRVGVASRRLGGTLSDISQRKRAETSSRLAQRRLRQTIQFAPTGIAIVAPEGPWLSANAALCDMLGYDEPGLLATTYQDITHPDDLATDLAHVEDLLAGRVRAYRMEKRYFHRQGRTVDVQLDVSLLRDEAGTPLFFIAHVQDVTERNIEHAALFEARRLAEVTLEAIGEGVIRIDAAGCITDINSAARSLLDFGDDPPIGRPFAEHVLFFDPDQDVQMPDPLARVLAHGERVRVPIFTRLRRRTGDFIFIVDSMSPVHDEAGAVSGAVFVFQDISEARSMTNKLLHQASHDALTGLPNRRGFEDTLAQRWQRLSQLKLPTFVLFLDLDHFKTINDTAGHAAGDELLRQIADAFRNVLRESDVLARLGGDEFAALVHAKDMDGAEIVAQKLIRVAGKLGFSAEGRRFGVGVSVGVAALDPALGSSEQAIIHADAALYVAKDRGRNRYHVYRREQHGGAAAAYLDTTQLLRTGLEQGRFVLYLQAIVKRDGTRVGFEALLRFNGEHGVVAPDAFLPTAKRLGMMTRIDRWVITEALDLVERYTQRGLWPAGCYLCINISPISLADPQFHEALIALLDRYRAQAGQFCFEITESDALFGEHYPQLIDNLRSRGFSVWLDDFASGYNGFDMLKRASIDGLKIDRSFVKDIEKDPVDRAVIRSIGDVAKALNLAVVAEGVETPEILALLERAGVTRFQGYLFHRPEPAEEALALPDAETPGIPLC